MIYFLKTYIEVENLTEAKLEANFMLKNLESFTTASLFKTEKYWKIENYFEVSFDLDSSLSFEELHKKLSNDWDSIGGEYIWNFQNEYFGISKRVRWASLEKIE